MTYSILYNRHLSRPQEFKSELSDRDAALAEASAYIFDGWLKVDCNPIAIIDWNARTINRIGFNEDVTTFEVKEHTSFGIGETNRFQAIYDSIENTAFTVSESFDGFADTVSAAGYVGTIIQLQHLPFCLLDWQEQNLHHLIRDSDQVVNVIQNYPDVPVGIHTTYENMEL